MTRQPGSDDSTPTPEELRHQVEGTREELGMTVEALAAKADVKAQAQAKAADIKAQAQAKAAEALDRAPQPVREKAFQVTEAARGGKAGPLLGFGLAALAVYVVVARGRRRR
ncbi:DUF3618 domain-containing protein [Streptomyces sp. NPDC058374]|uniref:DUF3618 domain-containing protein n=1 Tax=unclassified Streptomyces TaxID=2593676 RepID=UPI003656BEA6